MEEELHFDYGKVIVSHRLNINKPINHETKIINQGIRIGFEHKVKNFKGDTFWQIQILHKDENDKLQCELLDLEDYQIEIKHKGDMSITI